MSVVRRGAVPQVAAVITSPPYFALRRYGDSEQEVGLQGGGVDAYIEYLVRLMAEIRLRCGHKGTQYWVNLGDTANAYQHNRGAGGPLSSKRDAARQPAPKGLVDPCRSNKTFLGIPQRFAVGMVDAGFQLRATISWVAARLPETAQYRPRRSTETILFFTQHDRCRTTPAEEVPERCRTDLWKLPTARGGGHPAAFHEALPEACLEWLPEATGGVVLDPFSGSGTTARAASAKGRDSFGIDLYEWEAAT